MDLRVIGENFPYLMSGLRMTLILAVVTMIVSLPLGTLFGMARLAKTPLLRYPATLYVELMRSTPLIMVIFWVFFFLPKLIRMPLKPLTSGVVALVAFYASNIAEIVRAGIQSIPRGQTESGLSSGLTYAQTMRLIVLPQAIQNMIPALVSRFVALFMGTSLLYIIGVIEFFRAATIIDNREFRSLEIYTFVALTYFVFSFSISQVGQWCQRRLGAPRIGQEVGW